MKVNTALLICAVFMFRIVFFNIFSVPSFSARKTSGNLKSHFSAAMKRRVNFETADNLKRSEYSFAEVREKEGTNDSQSAASPFFLIQVLYSFVASEMTSKRKGVVSFYNYLSYTSSHRYLVLQVFRT